MPRSWPRFKVAGRHVSRSASRQVGRLARRQVGRSPGRHVSRSASRQVGRQVGRSAGWQVGRPPGRQVGQSAGRQVGMSASRQVGRSPGVTGSVRGADRRVNVRLCDTRRGLQFRLRSAIWDAVLGPEKTQSAAQSARNPPQSAAIRPQKRNPRSPGPTPPLGFFPQKRNPPGPEPPYYNINWEKRKGGPPIPGSRVPFFWGGEAGTVGGEGRAGRAGLTPAS